MATHLIPRGLTAALLVTPLAVSVPADAAIAGVSKTVYTGCLDRSGAYQRRMQPSYCALTAIEGNVPAVALSHARWTSAHSGRADIAFKNPNGNTVRRVTNGRFSFLKPTYTSYTPVTGKAGYRYKRITAAGKTYVLFK